MSKDQNAQDPLEFVRGMWNQMGFSLPGMVTPTLDVDELDKRIKDMKAVEGWLRMNLSMLQMTIQTLEMQCSTLNAVRAMGNIKPEALTPTPPPAAQSATPSSTPREAPDPLQSTMWPWALMQQIQTKMQQTVEQRPHAAPPKPLEKSA